MSALPVHVLLCWSDSWRSWAVIVLSRNAKLVEGMRRRLRVYCDLETVVVRSASMEDDDVFKAAKGLKPPPGRKSAVEAFSEPDDPHDDLPYVRPH